MIHFGRRERENLASLTRKDFAVKQDSDGALYVYKTTDEQNTYKTEIIKNHYKIVDFIDQALFILK
jgi:hypothetical protein